VKLNREHLATLPDFVPEQYIELAEGRRGYLIRRAWAAMYSGGNGASGRTLPVLALRRGQPVLASDGHAGNVERLLLAAQGQVRHFVLHRGRLRGRDVIVPVDWVYAVDERYVYLSVTRHALDDLPEYTPDSALAAEVDRALWSDIILREGDYPAIDPILREGVVVLQGHVASSAFKTRAERIARAVPGVRDVDNQLVADDDLVNQVAQALAGDGHTRGQSVRVYAQHGVVYLRGEVRSAEIRDAAEKCAAGLPQVRGVINGLKAPDAITADEDQRVLQPRIGQEVLTTDMPVGRVEKVIISPRNRRVTAFVAHGLFPESDHSDRHTLPINLPQRERRVVIPVAVVRDVTIGGVLLDIGSVEAARYEDFDAARFFAPDADWQPPYPYRQADALLI
jgi:osmotically-inducible protein OsmY